MNATDLDANSTALLLIDLQNFTLDFATHPRTPAECVTGAARLARACRTAGMPVILVRVGHPGSMVPPLAPLLEHPAQAYAIAPDGHTLCAALEVQPQDIIVDKYNWGAFHGTSLDTHLRRRGVTTLIVGGLVLGIGVDTTMREAMALGYDQILAEDTTTSFSAEEHDMILRSIMPRLARIRTVEAIIDAIFSGREDADQTPAKLS
ncbi:isochorismatase family protein [Novosphingobium lindaniclasticum]|uniref:Isochorismatase-like domain-containing protein n=1 Tax=Novosphingobium lindaniclasticum LE124 TaxID=1096930 RepID=T0HQD1_9SPHN|nr:isochorismatase family protein [Novosphingobium lindaniclasticum]EQB14328.1 hypothetical protein L284_13105 [Novosphingobium lindaniclasticum LE124]